MGNAREQKPSVRAVRRVHQWIRTYKSGRLHKVPSLDQAQFLVLQAIAGALDNEKPCGPLTGKPRTQAVGLGPTVWSLATIARLSHRWATETVRWLSQPIGDLDGRPLDLRGAAAAGGRRVQHRPDTVCSYMPFILIASGGTGGGRRNRMWLHPAFYEGTDKEFDMLKELPPWPCDPRSNRNSVPIQIGTGAAVEWELSSHKPSKRNTAGAGAPGEEPPSPPSAPVAAGAGRAPEAAAEVQVLPCSSPGAPAPAVLESSQVQFDGDRAGHEVQKRGSHPICDAAVGDQFKFLVEELGRNGVGRFDLMAPDRVVAPAPRFSENVNFRWTFRRDDGRRQNTRFGDQGALQLGGTQVVKEYSQSLPAILLDRTCPGRNGKPPILTLGRDFYWRAARHDSWPLIVLDDVDVKQLPLCRRFVLQTSADKFQALLLCDEVLDDRGRHNVQKHFASRGICDAGASSGSQPVRPPGSINRKPERDNFVTRLVQVRLSEPLLRVHEVRQLTAELDAPRTSSSSDSHSWAPAAFGAPRSVSVTASRTDFTPSGDDMSAAMRMLKRGAAADDVRSWLITSAAGRGKSDPDGYATITVKRAIFALAHGGRLPA